MTDKADPSEFGPRKRRRCDQCGAKIGPGRRFCSTPCRVDYWKLARVRGARMYERLYRWRMYRGKKGTEGAGQLSELARMLDEWHAEDTKRIRDRQGGDD